MLQVPKKLVRYLDNKVVSTKGERFTLFNKDDEDSLKKTYINLKPSKKYRFHWGFWILVFNDFLHILNQFSLAGFNFTSYFPTFL